MSDQPMMPIPDGSVIITPRQMYDEIQATRKAVDHLVGVVDPAFGELRQHVEHLDAQIVKQGTRLTIIETKQHVAWAVITLLVLAMGTVGAFVVH